MLPIMKVQGRHYRTVWLDEDDVLHVIDQRALPHRFVVESLPTLASVCTAIKEMHIRGAGLIGAVAGYGMYLAARESSADLDALERAGEQLCATRPTAVNLAWAVRRQLTALAGVGAHAERIRIARETAARIADEDAEFCRSIGTFGLPLIRELYERKGGAPVNILTHCNAGWLAFVDYGSATAPIYAAHEEGIPLHVWVDETRPRNQGAKLTAWELLQERVPHTVIADNTGGHLMQHGLVDLVIVGTDRTTAHGDVANKIGTYLKALAAKDNGVPFYVALPSSSIDWKLKDGLREIPIEERGAEEVRLVDGLYRGQPAEVLVPPAESRCANYGFDVTPARLITGLITERGICAASAAGLASLFPGQGRS